MATTKELTEKYISEHPSIKDCLKSGVINYSKLSRKIAKDLNIQKSSSEEAILIACRRYAEKIRKERAVEEKAISVLRNSELQIKNKITVAIIDKNAYRDNLSKIEKRIIGEADTFYAIEGIKAITIIASDKYYEEINRLFRRNIIKTTKDLVMITLQSPEELENVPGVMSYLYSRLSSHGVNIIETMSCWTDTIFVVSEDDIARVMKSLKI